MSQEFQLEIQCITKELKWVNQVDYFTSYVLQADPLNIELPSSGPFQVLQWPSCDQPEIVSLELTSPAGYLPDWISLD